MAWNARLYQCWGIGGHVAEQVEMETVIVIPVLVQPRKPSCFGLSQVLSTRQTIGSSRTKQP